MWSRPRKPQRKPKPSAPERLGLVGERRVVQAQLLHRVAQVLVLVGVDRVEPGEHHRLDLAEAGERLGRRVFVVGQRVADLAVADLLDVGDDEADLARPTASSRGAGFGREDAQLLDVVGAAR